MQMKHGTIDREFGDVNRAIIVSPASQLNGPKSSGVKINVPDSVFDHELRGKSCFAIFVHRF